MEPINLFELLEKHPDYGPAVSYIEGQDWRTHLPTGKKHNVSNLRTCMKWAVFNMLPDTTDGESPTYDVLHYQVEFFG